MQILQTPPPDRHSPAEDLHAIVIGAVLVALGIQFLRASDLITGQVAGLALIASKPTGLSFGAVFFVMNLPFYVLALSTLGLRFTIKSLSAAGLMAVLADSIPLVVHLDPVHPAIGATVFGILAGMGLLSLFRHGATLGGFGIVALWLQDTRGWRAGQIQLAVDAAIFTMALLYFSIEQVIWSLMGAVILNMILTINHRRDRYIARS
ncbi:YitT family protein [Mesobacterium sp. TK19101]|uniref:YitT family protein n=1 Tax=Mesobacterium hydrothermale TaxID=3111907 RepID=A0ABU6HF61_9RHOB|nr:YitT family protein [Mesobacterium sp. TK19101]MEC3861109.1 YitT family protein [Mesobacterium sp. TK19101]